MPVRAQVTGSLGIQNTYRVRGYSVSGGHPAGTLDVYFEDPSGMYLNLSAIGALDHAATPVFLGYVANAGYARRISNTVSLDGGIVRTQFSRSAAYPSSHVHYTELYMGAAGHGLSVQLHYSPDYYRSDISTLYGEIDGVLSPAEKWQVSGHIGLLGYLSHTTLAANTSYDPSPAVRYDWRAGVARQLGSFSLHGDLTGGGVFSDRIRHGRSLQATALTIGANWVF